MLGKHEGQIYKDSNNCKEHNLVSVSAVFLAGRKVFHRGVNLCWYSFSYMDHVWVFTLGLKTNQDMWKQNRHDATVFWGLY